MAAPIVVHAPDEEGGRRVRASDTILGRAFSTTDLLEFLRRAGLDPDDTALDDPGLIEWRGGGPDVWGPPPPKSVHPAAVAKSTSSRLS
ncbi:hypothetical protein SALCHL_000492 [Streptomyces albus subsp. chlorinus]|uniref:hypothetical protein n=1 Tax=Streptomyces albus TaxID=1888 RepID=UPI001FAD66EB|nr:hypothetical protein [Streptomyces albus]